MMVLNIWSKLRNIVHLMARRAFQIGITKKIYDATVYYKLFGQCFKKKSIVYDTNRCVLKCNFSV